MAKETGLQPIVTDESALSKILKSAGVSNTVKKLDVAAFFDVDERGKYT